MNPVSQPSRLGIEICKHICPKDDIVSDWTAGTWLRNLGYSVERIESDFFKKLFNNTCILLGYHSFKIVPNDVLAMKYRSSSVKPDYLPLTSLLVEANYLLDQGLLHVFATIHANSTRSRCIMEHITISFDGFVETVSTRTAKGKLTCVVGCISPLKGKKDRMTGQFPNADGMLIP